MKIDRIDVYYVSLPLIYPWRTAYGEDDAVHSVLVRMVSDETVGWGETTPLKAPAYSPETAMSAYYTITEFIAPALVGKTFETPDQLLRTIAWIKGNPFAKAGPRSRVVDAQSRDGRCTTAQTARWTVSERRRGCRLWGAGFN